MITIEDQVKRYLSMLNNMVKDEEKTANGIKIPYSDIASVWKNFIPGKCYSFFATEKFLNAWRINMLWKMAKNNTPIYILKGGMDFDKDFVDLLCLESKLDITDVEYAPLKKENYEKLSATLDNISTFPIYWVSDDIIPQNTAPQVCVKTLSLRKWRKEAQSLWDEARDANAVLILFVKIPSGFEEDFRTLYEPYEIILPENLSSHIAIIKTMKYTLKEHNYLLSAKLKQTNSLKKDSFMFYCTTNYPHRIEEFTI